MRERFLEAFDAIRIDCLNGDKYKTGKVAPDGTPDPSIFSTEGDPVGIQVGTAIATLVRNAEHVPTKTICFRHLWGRAKRAELLETAEAEPESLYETLEPILPLGLPLVRTAVSGEWFDWPSLPDLFPVTFPGVKTSRDGFLVDVDLDRLRTRIADYFDPGLSHEETGPILIWGQFRSFRRRRDFASMGPGFSTPHRSGLTSPMPATRGLPRPLTCSRSCPTP